MISGALIKTSLVDYPGCVAATYFLSGCNIRCPYCYNGELVLQTMPEEDSKSLTEVYKHLEKRKNVLSGFVLSGGEPLLYPEVSTIIKTVKNLGYKVKLDTNGLFPERLEFLFESEETSPDYVAVDIKTSPNKYDIVHFYNNATEKLSRTIEVLQALPNENKEFRTVLCPPLVSKEDIIIMAKLLPKDAKWFFAPFRNENCLDPTYNTIKPYTDDEMETIVKAACQFIEKSMLR